MPRKFVPGRAVAACRRKSPFPVPTSISTGLELPNRVGQLMGTGGEEPLPNPSPARGGAFSGSPFLFREGGWGVRFFTSHIHGASCSLDRRRGLRTAQLLQFS